MVRTENNPLLGDAGLRTCLLFSVNQTLHWLKVLVDQAEVITTRVSSPETPATWSEMVGPLEDAHDRLGQAWGRILHLNRVISAPKWRQVIKRGNGLVIGHWTRYKQSTELCEKYKRLRNSGEYRRLNAAQKRVVDLSIRDFNNNGANLPAAKKRQVAKLSLSLSSLSKDFSNRLIDAAAATKVSVTEAAEISGVPSDLRAIAKKRAYRAGHSDWEFTLQGYEPQILLQSADSRVFRRRMYSAMISQASDLGPAKYDTTKIIYRILKQRQELARLLGFQTFADYSLSVKMAKTYPRALGFAKRLAVIARQPAQKDLLMLEKFAARHLKLTSLKPWDISYVMDKFKAEKYGYTQSELHQYLPYQAVFKTLADTIWRLFRVRLIKDHSYRTYHPDVTRYRITTPAGKLLGHVVVDLFARPMKKAGAWVSKDTSRRIINGRMRVPVANCTCNFTPPDKNGQSFLTPANFHTLFHEFGHIMNHILSDVVESAVGGTSNVERDALELPSQWLARFSTEPSVLRKVSDHGAASLPLAAQNQIIHSTKIFKGWNTLRQASFGLYDLSLHHIQKPRLATQLKYWRSVARRYEIMRRSSDDRTPNSFDHLFSGSYAAGYYSYLWAEVMAADAFKPFRNNHQHWTKLGNKFAREILGPGGSRPASVSFRHYRGRQPKIVYLLEDYGLK